MSEAWLGYSSIITLVQTIEGKSPLFYKIAVFDIQCITVSCKIKISEIIFTDLNQIFHQSGRLYDCVFSDDTPSPLQVVVVFI